MKDKLQSRKYNFDKCRKDIDNADNCPHLDIYECECILYAKELTHSSRMFERCLECKNDVVIDENNKVSNEINKLKKEIKLIKKYIGMK